MARKKGSAPNDGSGNGNDNASRLYDWISKGYRVDALVESVRQGDSSRTEALFSDFDAKAQRLEAAKAKLATLGFSHGHPMYQKVADKLGDPLQADALEALAAALESGPKIMELRQELASLNTNGFEADAQRIHKMLDSNDDPDIIDAEIKKLRKRIKEAFFEAAFESEAVVEEAPKPQPQARQAPAQPQQGHFVAETIFLLHRDGTLLSVKSKKPTTELDKKLMSRMVMAIREQMGRAFKEGEHIHSLTYEGHTIILEDSVHIYAAVVVVGEPRAVMYKVILKALQIMEKNMAQTFDSWKGDRNSLENLDKYTSAIFQALEKSSGAHGQQ